MKPFPKMLPWPVSMIFPHGSCMKMKIFLFWINRDGLFVTPRRMAPGQASWEQLRNTCSLDTVHLASRLDRETSGVVLLAKHKKAASYWQKGIEFKKVRRNYLAILEGELPAGKVRIHFFGQRSR